MIQDIAIEQLDIHPQNVRKVYTDIDELAESIKARGVMQNLTVVPNPDKKDHYLVVIGNRRLTAARKAGLKTMPCSVVEMTEKEQISTMLLENMQRSDLSVSEQAQGFQLMLDLGETETTIAEKTGFSRNTVRHRLNLAKLDQETLTRREKNKDFQLTLTDLYELEKVQDIKKRNEILKTAVSSREIAWKAKQAVKEEKIKKNAQIVFEILEEKGVKAAPERAKEERWTGKWKEITNIDLSQWEDQTKIDLQDTKDQLYYYQYYDRIYVVKKVIQKEREKTEQEKKTEKIKENKRKITEILKRMRRERNDFIKELVSGKITIPKEVDVKETGWKIMINRITDGGSVAHMNAAYGFYGMIEVQLLEFDRGEQKFASLEELKERIEKEFAEISQEKQMLILLTRTAEPYEATDYYGHYEKGMKCLRDFYRLLQQMGFSFRSLEELKILNGTHELYTQETEDEH